MRLVLRVLGTDVLDVELSPTRPTPAPAPSPPRCRYEAPKLPTLEATAGGEFAFGFDQPGTGADLRFGERPTTT